MEELAKFLSSLCPMDRPWESILVDANWNHVLQCLFLFEFDPNATLEFWLDTSTRQTVTMISKNYLPELQACIKAIPLPNSKVVFSSYSASQGLIMGKPADTRQCPTIGDLLALVGDKKCSLVEGWPVARRFGQNAAQFSSNKGLRVVLEYGILTGYSRNKSEKNLTQ